MCYQTGSMSIARLGLPFLWVWALYMACYRADLSLSGWNSGSDIVVPIHFVVVSGPVENNAFRGASEQ